VYLDDILVMGRTFRSTWTRLRGVGLRLKPEKRHLAKRDVCYLGYVVSVKGISADPSKVEVVIFQVT